MSEPLVSRSLSRRVAFVFAWYDVWIGLYYNRAKRLLYILPLPTVGISIYLGPSSEER